MDQVPVWLEGTGIVATTLGVLAALYVAIWREPRKAREERTMRDEQAAEDRRRYDDQMAALKRAEDDRIAAQARKVVPNVNHVPLFGENIWLARVLNTSAGAITSLGVLVAEFDSEGKLVPDGAQPSNDQVDVSGGLQRMVSDAIAGALGGVLTSNPVANMMQQFGLGQSGMDAGQLDRALERQFTPQMKAQIQEAMTGQLMTEWPTTLGPNQTAIMAYRCTTPGGQLRIAIAYEDEAGYRWERAGGNQPSRSQEEVSETAVSTTNGETEEPQPAPDGRRSRSGGESDDEVAQRARAAPE